MRTPESPTCSDLHLAGLTYRYLTFRPKGMRRSSKTLLKT